MNWVKDKKKHDAERKEVQETVTQFRTSLRRQSRRKCALLALLGGRYCQLKPKLLSTFRFTCTTARGVPIASLGKRDWHHMLYSQPTEKGWA